MNRPETAYRFIRLKNVDRLQETFIESSLYFAKPSQFNDPFEFKPKRMTIDGSDLEESLLRKYVDPNLNLFYQAVCTELDNFGVCSFSEKHDNVLMWSHYSENHSGACLGFDTKNEFFKTLQPVDYKSERHDIDLENWKKEDIVFKVMLRKLRSWCYEKEWRLIRKPGKELVPFSPDMLKSVIFGARCPETRIKLVKTLIGSRKVNFYKAEIDKYEYKLNIFSL